MLQNRVQIIGEKTYYYNNTINSEKADFDQRLECAASKCWLKYFTPFLLNLHLTSRVQCKQLALSDYFSQLYFTKQLNTSTILHHFHKTNIFLNYASIKLKVLYISTSKYAFSQFFQLFCLNWIRTSNDINAGNGREGLMMAIKFSEICWERLLDLISLDLIIYFVIKMLYKIKGKQSNGDDLGVDQL